jgi:hypothetical protein
MTFRSIHKIVIVKSKYIALCLPANFHLENLKTVAYRREQKDDHIYGKKRVWDIPLKTLIQFIFHTRLDRARVKNYFMVSQNLIFQICMILNRRLATERCSIPKTWTDWPTTERQLRANRNTDLHLCLLCWSAFMLISLMAVQHNLTNWLGFLSATSKETC